MFWLTFHKFLAGENWNQSIYSWATQLSTSEMMLFYQETTSVKQQGEICLSVIAIADMKEDVGTLG